MHFVNRSSLRDSTEPPPFSTFPLFHQISLPKIANLQGNRASIFNECLRTIPCLESGHYRTWVHMVMCEPLHYVRFIYALHQWLSTFSGGDPQNNPILTGDPPPQ